MIIAIDPVASLALTSYINIQGDLTRRAIDEWDRVGQGDFLCFVECYVMAEWIHLCELN